MKRYSFDLVANVPMPVEIGGTYLVVDAAPTPFKIEFFGANRIKREEEIEAAVVSDWATPENGFTSLVLTSPVTQTVAIYIARGRMGRNVFSGVVAVSSVAFPSLVGQVETENGKAFQVRFDGAPGGAGVFIHSQLKNPAASGKIVLVDAIDVGQQGATEFSYYGRRDADLTNLQGTGSNKNIGGAASTAQLRHVGNAGSLLTDTFGITSALIYESRRVTFFPPLRLAAGVGFCVHCGVANQGHRITYHFREY